MIDMVTFDYPQRLAWMAVAVGLGLFYIVLSIRRGSGGRRSSNLDAVLPRDSALKRHMTVLASLLSLCALIVAWAKPMGVTQQPRERATVVVAIDVSLSMEATDVSPNRLDAAKTAATEFVDELPPTFNVSVVAFSGTATMVAPPTQDRGLVKRAIEGLELAPSTAIGEAVYASLGALALAPPDPDHPDEPAPGAVVLLSDGETNIGRSSEQAAQAAKEQGVPVHTIAYGTDSGYLIENGQRVPVPVDHYELAALARVSGGKKYAADTLGDLSEVYAELARSVGYEDVETEITQRYALYGLILAVIAGTGVVSLAARWP